MALWECLGKVANIAGPVGVDMFKLIGMIVKGVETVRRNHEECQQLSHFASATDNLLHELANLKVIEHPKMWKPIQGLRGTLLQAYMLIKSCQHRSPVTVGAERNGFQHPVSLGALKCDHLQRNHYRLRYRG
jgi:hypothetical protein